MLKRRLAGDSALILPYSVICPRSSVFCLMYPDSLLSCWPAYCYPGFLVCLFCPAYCYPGFLVCLFCHLSSVLRLLFPAFSGTSFCLLSPVSCILCSITISILFNFVRYILYCTKSCMSSEFSKKGKIKEAGSSVTCQPFLVCGQKVTLYGTIARS